MNFNVAKENIQERKEVKVAFLEAVDPQKEYDEKYGKEE